MSLIALTFTNGFPALIGDILLSSENKEKNIELPVHFKGVNDYLPATQKFYPAAFGQKLSIITDDIAVAVAGLVSELEFLLKELKDFFKYQSFREGETKDKIRAFVDNFPWNEEYKNSQLILLHQTSAKFFVYNHGCSQHSNSVYENVLIGGSGKEQFLTLIESDFQITVDKNLTQKLHIIGNHLSLFAKLLVREKENLDPLLDCFGTGYEIVCWNFHEGKLKKPDNITYAYIKLKMDSLGNPESYFPVSVYNFKYKQDTLFISVFDTIEQGVRVFVANPLDKKISQPENYLRYLNFEAPTICVSIHTYFSSGEEKFSYLTTGSENITINASSANLENTRIDLVFKNDFMDKVLDFINGNY